MPVSINDYIKQYSDSKNKAYCCRGHELIFCHGEKNKPYFRHKNPGDIEDNNLSELVSKNAKLFAVTKSGFQINIRGKKTKAS